MTIFIFQVFQSLGEPGGLLLCRKDLPHTNFNPILVTVPRSHYTLSLDLTLPVHYVWGQPSLRVSCSDDLLPD